MKLLLVSRMDGWAELYVSQLAEAMRRAGADCRPLNYRARERRGLTRLLHPKRAEEMIRARRTDAVVEALRDWRPDAVVFSRERFDFARVRDACGGAMVFWDVDGPAGALPEGGALWEAGWDAMLTASRAIERMGRARGFERMRYWPFGADTDFYAPGAVTEAQRKRLGAPLAFVGRPCARRVKMLEAVADLDLVIWGDKWLAPRRRSESLAPCVREREDVVGRDLVDTYRATTVAVNVVRAPFMLDPPSMLNIQVFLATACGTCLLTDRVEELEEAFEIGREVLAFRSAEEMRELAARYSRDAAAARAVGEAGRKRCEAEHSLLARARRLIAILEELR